MSVYVCVFWWEHTQTKRNSIGKIMVMGIYVATLQRHSLQFVLDNTGELSFKEKLVLGASLVAQRLRICLLMQGTWVRALVWEDPTCHGAAGPVSHNY